VAIDVSDLARSEAWYRRALHLERLSAQVSSDRTGHVALRHSDSGTVVALQTAAAAGVEHVSFRCADKTQLEHWRASLYEVGAAPGTVTEAPYGTGFIVIDPDGTRLELFAPAS
jgi:catechol 2,3-dioxygenase-like lactoylglutathione lyase family enzyme